MSPYATFFLLELSIWSSPQVWPWPTWIGAKKAHRAKKVHKAKKPTKALWVRTSSWTFFKLEKKIFF